MIITGQQALAVASGFQMAIAEAGYQLHACAILPDHVHLVIGPHSRNIRVIVGHLKSRATRALKSQGLWYGDGRPVWGAHGWNVRLEDLAAVERAMEYVDQNPEKEGKRRQRWRFVVPFDLEVAERIAMQPASRRAAELVGRRWRVSGRETAVACLVRLRQNSDAARHRPARFRGSRRRACSPPSAVASRRISSPGRRATAGVSWRVEVWPLGLSCGQRVVGRPLVDELVADEELEFRDAVVFVEVGDVEVEPAGLAVELVADRAVAVLRRECGGLAAGGGFPGRDVLRLRSRRAASLRLRCDWDSCRRASCRRRCRDLRRNQLADRVAPDLGVAGLVA